MQKSNVVFFSLVAACLLLSSGCAGKPTTADLMRQVSTEERSLVDLKNRLAKDWEAGTKLVSSGEKRVKNGEKRVKSAERDLKKGQADIERGKREIAEGQRLIQKSESRFRENFPDVDIKAGR